jgi:sn-glycerol 3-phosphate transport system substrate-binding protein
MRTPRTHRTVRHTIAVLVVAAALLGASCGDSSSDTSQDDSGGGGDLPTCPLDALASAAGPVEVVVWHSYVAKTEQTLERLIAEYNASQTTVVVRAESQGTSYEELWDKYQQSAPTGQLPAVAILEDTSTQAIADSSTVLPAQSCIDADDYDTSDLVQTGIDYYSIDGAFYPGSINMSSPLLYVNKNHLRRAGLDPETQPQTLDELRNVAQAIKDSGATQTPLAMNLTSWYIETWLTGDGQPVVDNQNGRGDGETTAAAFDDAATLSIYQWIKDMHDDGLLLAIPVVSGNIDHLLALSGDSPRASMTFETSTAATSIVAFLGGDRSVVDDAGGDAGAVNVSGVDVGALLMPGVTEAGQVQIGGGAWYMTNTTPPEVQAAAWDFLKWWNRTDTQIQWNIEGSYIPFSISAAQSPAVQAFWQDDLAGQWLALSYQQLSDGVDPQWPGPLIGPYQDVRTAIEDGLNELTLEGKAPQDVLTQSSDAATDAIETYNEGAF